MTDHFDKLSTAPKRPLKVFLCHARDDKPRVRELYRYLKKRGIQPWLDAEDLLPGQHWQVEIPKAIEESDAIIICLSKASVDKEGYIQKEIYFALQKTLEMPEGGIFLIPALLEECTIPASLKRYHWVDLSATEGYRKLMRSLKTRAGQLQQISIEVAQQPGAKKLHQFNKVEIMIILIGLAGIIISSLMFVKGWPTLASISTTKSFGGIIPTVHPDSNILWAVEVVDAKGVVMRLIPAGEFTMGNKYGAQEDEKPDHSVQLSAYYIDKYEVTNKLYSGCVNEGYCQSPSNTSSYSRLSYYNNPQFNNYPVIYVDWNMAKVYCTWREARLPSEAEWEKAAQGPEEAVHHRDEEDIQGIQEDLHRQGLDEKAIHGILTPYKAFYPWGYDDPNDHLLNYNSNVGDTSAIGSYPNGKSIYDVYDMAGNVNEWVNDWYSDTFYAVSSLVNPSGPDFGQYRILRGGSFLNNDFDVYSTKRFKHFPDSKNYTYGFRCARSAP